MTDHHHNQHHDERDSMLAGMLADLAVPDHSESFWSDLDGRLANESTVEPAPLVDDPAASDPPVSDPSTNGRVSTLDPSTRPEVTAQIHDLEQRRSPARDRRLLTVVGAGLVAVAASIALLVGFGVIGSDQTPDSITTDPADGPDSGVTTPDGDQGAVQPDPPHDTSGGEIDYAHPIGVRELGPGSLVGFSPDGSSVLVLDDHPSGELGSEGATVLTVWAYPVEGGERRLAVPEDESIETGTSGESFVIGAGSDIAWSEWCDGFLCGMRMASLSSTGDISEIVQLDLAPVSGPDNQNEPSVNGLALGSDGSLYFGANGQLAIARRGSPSIELVDGVTADAAVVVDGSDGERVLTIGDDNTLREGTEQLTEALDVANVRQLVATPDGRVLVIGSAEFALVELPSGAVERIVLDEADQEQFDVSFTPDGRVSAAIYGRDLTFEETSDGADLAVMPLGSSPHNGAFSPDGSVYAVTVTADNGLPAILVIDFVARDALSDASSATGGPTEVVEIASFTTEFACCQNRVTNIEVIAGATDGLVIPAGETFSLNDATGQRTEERGYVADGAIVNGVLEPVIGGGVSQYATTLFNAAVFGGMAFEEYQSHSLYISRYPFGRDASLSWPQPDLVLRNDTGYDITIRNSVTATSITVSLWSTGSVEVDVSDTVRSSEGSCTRAETERTRTFPDGTVVQDTIIALYLPGEGFDCNGDAAPETD